MKLNWKTTKPTKPGAYWVRGYHMGHRKDAAVVDVREINGVLSSNLNAVNSDNSPDEFFSIERHSNDFEWCGPLVPPKDK